MTLFVPSGGKRLTYTAIVTTADPVALISVPEKSFLYTVESLGVRLIGTDVSFDFLIDNGSQSVSVAGKGSISAETFWNLSDHHVTVEYGKTLMFAAGGSTEMHVTVVALETDTSGQGRR